MKAVLFLFALFLAVPLLVQADTCGVSSPLLAAAPALPRRAVPRRRHLVSCPNLFSVLLAIRLATAQGNCPSNDCSSCPCGYSSSYVDIGSACSQFSGWDQGCCQCIANHESGGTVVIFSSSLFVLQSLLILI